MSEDRWERVNRLIERIRALQQEPSREPERPRPGGPERGLAERMRRELLRYEEHRDRLSPSDRERLLDFIVDDLVGLARMYAPAPQAAAPAPADAPGLDRALRLLVDAGRALSESLEYEASLDRLARLCVEWFADECAVHLAGPPVRCVAYVGRGAGRTGLLAALGADPRRADPPDHPVAAALASGARVDVPGAAGEPAAMVLPLRARERVLGAVTLARAGGGYGADEVALAEELARRAALAVEDARLRDEVEGARRARADFVGTISHEFRTPLMTVVAFAHLLDDGIPAPLPEPAREHVARILAAAGHLDRLVEESLGFRRVESGWNTVRRERVDLADLARETAAMMEPLARQRGLDFQVRTGEGPLFAETDPDKVRQILFNLLDNAVKFTDVGGVRLVLWGEGERCVLEVSDTGIGIGPEDLEQVFEPFWRVAPDPARGPGIGLGLSLARRLAWMLGGDVSVESEPGEGSVFRAGIPSGGEGAGSGE